MAQLFDRDETIRINAGQEIGNGGGPRTERPARYDLRSGTRDRPSLRRRLMPRDLAARVSIVSGGYDRARSFGDVSRSRCIPARPSRIKEAKIARELAARKVERWAI